MTRYVTLTELLRLYCGVMELTGESGKVQNLSRLVFGKVRPQAHAGRHDMFRTLSAKAAALCSSLAHGRSFSAGNTRVAHAALETMLVLNGFEIAAPFEEQERVMRAVSDERIDEHQLALWVESHCRALPQRSRSDGL